MDAFRTFHKWIVRLVLAQSLITLVAFLWFGMSGGRALRITLAAWVAAYIANRMARDYYWRRFGDQLMFERIFNKLSDGARQLDYDSQVEIALRQAAKAYADAEACIGEECLESFFPSPDMTRWVAGIREETTALFEACERKHLIARNSLPDYLHKVREPQAQPALAAV